MIILLLVIITLVISFFFVRTTNLSYILVGFLTAMRQEVTRAHKGWSLDGVILHNDVTKLSKEDITEAPAVSYN